MPGHARLRRMGIGGVLLDIDGVLAVSWDPIPGAVDALGWLRARGMPFRLITNTTTHTREDLAATLRSAGFEVDASEIVTAVVATAAYLRANHPGARVLVISDGDALGDLEDVDVVGLDERADVVVIGGASDVFTYHAMNRAFDDLMGGAALVGMHRNLYWRTTEGLQLDGGAYLAGLEEASGVRAMTSPRAGLYTSRNSRARVSTHRPPMKFWRTSASLEEPALPLVASVATAESVMKPPCLG